MLRPLSNSELEDFWKWESPDAPRSLGNVSGRKMTLLKEQKRALNFYYLSSISYIPELMLIISLRTKKYISAPKYYLVPIAALDGISVMDYLRTQVQIFR
jgi:hypothetical protein